MSSPPISILETLALRAMPALETEVLDGWLLRASGGYSKRSNSVNCLKPPKTDLGDRIAQAEHFYAARKLPAIFRLTPISEPELEAELIARGYEPEGVTDVLTLALERQPPSHSAIAMDAIATDAIATDQWIRLFAHSHDLNDHDTKILATILSSIAPRSAFARLGQQAVGRAVFEAGYVGLFSLATMTNARRQGHARTISQALLRWGSDQGAHHAYLQVEQDNEAARTLYKALGFNHTYSYHYLIRP
jgi:ribosomal protein S18 acetylase RimI-like enzyme